GIRGTLGRFRSGDGCCPPPAPGFHSPRHRGRLLAVPPSGNEMNRLITLVLALGLVAQPAMSRDWSEDEAAIRGIDTAWSAALGQKDLDAVISVYADDAVFLAPNQPIIEGRDAIGAWFKARFETPGYDASFVPT